MPEQKRVALFIDADNISPKYLPAIMRELTSKFGEVTYRRAYGNWFHANSKWEDMLSRYSMQPVFQPANAKGKNTADIKLIINAMDALYNTAAEIFCIVSSDSDFTRLATRLRESGMVVYGMGEKKTPAAFTAACDKFVYIDVLAKQAEQEEKEKLLQYLVPVSRWYHPVFCTKAGTNRDRQSDGRVHPAHFRQYRDP